MRLAIRASKNGAKKFRAKRGVISLCDVCFKHCRHQADYSVASRISSCNFPPHPPQQWCNLAHNFYGPPSCDAVETPATINGAVGINAVRLHTESNANISFFSSVVCSENCIRQHGFQNITCQTVFFFVNSCGISFLCIILNYS